MKVYIIGSLRNPVIPEVANQLRKLGHDVFDDWYSAGEKADDSWQAYETARGNTYQEALKGHAAKHVFGFDKSHLDSADVGVLVLPAGKSGHLELGYLAGRGKLTYVLFDKSPERWDVMYQFASGVCFSFDELISTIRILPPTRGLLTDRENVLLQGLKRRRAEYRFSAPRAPCALESPPRVDDVKPLSGGTFSGLTFGSSSGGLFGGLAPSVELSERPQK